MAAATVERETGRLSVAEAMRPLRERAAASASPVFGPVTEQMVAEACRTLVRDRQERRDGSALGTSFQRRTVTAMLLTKLRGS